MERLQAMLGELGRCPQRLAPLPTAPKPLPLDDLVKIKGLSNCARRYLPKLEKAEETQEEVHFVPSPPSGPKPPECSRRLRMFRNTCQTENVRPTRLNIYQERAFIKIVAPLFKPLETEKPITNFCPRTVPDGESKDGQLSSEVKLPLDSLNIHGKALPVLPHINQEPHIKLKAKAKLDGLKMDVAFPYNGKAATSLGKMKPLPVVDIQHAAASQLGKSVLPKLKKVKPEVVKHEIPLKKVSPILETVGFVQNLKTEKEEAVPKMEQVGHRQDTPVLHHASPELQWDEQPEPNSDKADVKVKRLPYSFILKVHTDENNNDLMQDDLDEEDLEVRQITNTPESTESPCTSPETPEAAEVAQAPAFPVMPWHVLPHPRIAQIKRAGSDGGIGPMYKRSLRAARLPQEEAIPITEGGQFARPHTPVEWRRATDTIRWAHNHHRPGDYAMNRPALEHYLLKRQQDKHGHENG